MKYKIVPDIDGGLQKNGLGFGIGLDYRPARHNFGVHKSVIFFAFFFWPIEFRIAIYISKK